MSDDYSLARDTPLGARFLIETPGGTTAITSTTYTL